MAGTEIQQDSSPKRTPNNQTQSRAAFISAHGLKVFFHSCRVVFFLFLLLLAARTLFPHLISPFNSRLTQEIERPNFLRLGPGNGIHFTHHSHRAAHGYPALEHLKPWFGSTSASVAVFDVNQDGFLDLFFPSGLEGMPSHLYLNERNGRFREAGAEFGLDRLPPHWRAIFADFDLDGKPELLITTEACPLVYRSGPDGKFSLHSSLRPCAFGGVTAVNVIDWNQDGYLDLVLGASGQGQLPNNGAQSDGGGVVQLLLNVGGAYFADAGKDIFSSGRSFTHAIGAGDLRTTGRLDLWLAADFGKDKVFLSDASGPSSPFRELRPFSDRPFLSNTGMSAELGFLEDFLHPVLFVSHAYQPGYWIGGNALWTWTGSRFRNIADQQGVSRCGWAWGAKFADLNNDSLPDLVVANGFIGSKTPGKSSDYWFRISTLMASPRFHHGLASSWFPMDDATNFAGHQKDCVFLNSAEGFVNISESIGFDPENHEGRGVATADLLNDGRISIVVANQLQRPDVYLNVSKGPGRWVGFRLRGKRSEAEAIGAQLSLLLRDGRTLRSTIQPLNGYSAQSDSRAHFGLGDAQPKLLSIRWPSGETQELIAPLPGRYHLIQKTELR